MKKKVLWQCDGCGTEYNEEIKAHKCEHSHKAVKDIHDTRYHANGEYPDRIEVTFLDGKKIWYKR